MKITDVNVTERTSHKCINSQQFWCTQIIVIDNHEKLLQKLRLVVSSMTRSTREKGRFWGLPLPISTSALLPV